MLEKIVKLARPFELDDLSFEELGLATFIQVRNGTISLDKLYKASSDDKKVTDSIIDSLMRKGIVRIETLSWVKEKSPTKKDNPIDNN